MKTDNGTLHVLSLIHICLVNSTPKQRAAAQTLGLNKIGKTVTREDTPALRGQLLVLRHLVTVEEAD